jgi:hypothetical protein
MRLKMKKALEAGIKHCSLFEKYLTHLPEMVDFYYKQRTILQVMLAAIDAEPEKPESQESIVDWDAVCRVIDSTGIERTYANAVWCALQDQKSQWLHPKPAIHEEPEKPEPQGSVEELAKFIHDVYEDKAKSVGWNTQESCKVDWDDLPEKNKIVMRYVAYNVMQSLHPKPDIDPGIKKVYDEWKKNDGIVVMERAFEREMWNCIKAHVERGE